MRSVYIAGLVSIGITGALIIGCGGQSASSDVDSDVKFKDLTGKSIRANKGAYIPSQCYTKTEGREGEAHNPCYSCHTASEEPNYIDDWDLQESYDFSEYTKVNRWSNLFEENTPKIAAISDAEIMEYVREDNYLSADSEIKLAKQLQNLPKELDYNSNGTWDGYMPDCYFDFDTKGFDRAPDGSYTGWRAFAYRPFLGTFWPTNGSTDDVLIRLPESMRQNSQGEFDKEVYILNLAIVESLIKEENIGIEPVDERVYGVDLNQDGELGSASEVVFAWKTPEYDFASGHYSGYSMWYVGAAKEKQQENTLHMAPGLYPEGTEFLHTVRYIDLDGDAIKLSPRLKELRYGKKQAWNTYPELYNASMAEIKEKDDFPDRLRTIVGDMERGLNTGLGWVYQGFIEDAAGELRPQTYEETLFCIGCHSGIGAITDSTFVFPRKLDHSHSQKGWYHWSQHGMKGLKDYLLKSGEGEYAKYLRVNRAGDEFRENSEVMEKFFHPDGSKKSEAFARLKEDITYLIMPPPKRARELNKAYRVIVDEQSYIYGRDVIISAPQNIHRELEVGESTGLDAIENR